jgi:hypothetical protein
MDEKDEFNEPMRRHERGYSKVWSLPNVSITALDNAVIFFTA